MDINEEELSIYALLLIGFQVEDVYTKNILLRI